MNDPFKHNSCFFLRCFLCLRVCTTREGWNALFVFFPHLGLSTIHCLLYLLKVEFSLTVTSFEDTAICLVGESIGSWYTVSCYTWFKGIQWTVFTIFSSLKIQYIVYISNCFFFSWLNSILKVSIWFLMLIESLSCIVPLQFPFWPQKGTLHHKCTSNPIWGQL